MILKADGDSPLGQRPLSALQVVYRLWASLRIGHLKELLRSRCLNLFLVWVMACVLWKLGFSTVLNIEKVHFCVGGISCMSRLLMSLSPLTQLTGPFLIVL